MQNQSSSFVTKHRANSYAYRIEKELWEKSHTRLADLCKRLHYPDIVCRIMALDESLPKHGQQLAIKNDKELMMLYLKFSKDENSNIRKGANRSWTEYFKQLIAGWIEEDLFILMLNGNGIEAKRNGIDSKRVIDLGCRVTQSPDLVVSVGGKERRVELTNEYNDFLERQGFIEKRSPAVFKMWEEGAIWLYRDRMFKKYVLVDFANESTTVHLRHHNTVSNGWSKDVHRYVLAENGKTARDDSKLVSELISVVSGGAPEGEKPRLDEVEDNDSPPVEYTIGGKRRDAVSRVEVDEKQPVSPAHSAKAEPVKKAAVADKVQIQEETPKEQKQQKIEVEEKKTSPKPVVKKETKPKIVAPTVEPVRTEQLEEQVDDIVSDNGESDIDGDWDSYQVDDGGFV